MKKILCGLVSMLFLLSLTSCSSICAETAYEDEVYYTSDNVSIVVTYGTPYYYNGSLWYYYYNGLYYYPFYYDGYWYFRPYRTLYSWDWYYNYHFRPTHNDHVYRFRPGRHGFTKPHDGHHGRPHEGYRPNHNGRNGHGNPNHNGDNRGRRPNHDGGYNNHHNNGHNGDVGRPNGNGRSKHMNGGNQQNQRPRPQTSAPQRSRSGVYNAPQTPRSGQRSSGGNYSRPNSGSRPSGGNYGRPGGGSKSMGGGRRH